MKSDNSNFKIKYINNHYTVFIDEMKLSQQTNTNKIIHKDIFHNWVDNGTISQKKFWKQAMDY